jgi:hypothetical protein
LKFFIFERKQVKLMQFSTNFRLFKFSIITYVVIGSLMTGCNQDKGQGEEANDSMISQTESQKYWSSASKTFQKITLSDTAVVRNIRWLQSLSSLNEKIELSESQPTNGKSYSLYLDDSDLNFVDIVYLTNNQNQIIQVVVDIYVEDKTEANKLLDEFEQYFTVKFGQKRTVEKGSTWISKDKTNIHIENVSTPKDPGIKLTYSLIN